MDLETARQILIHHSKSSLNGRFPLQFTHENQLTNPLCGDHVQIKLHIDEQSIFDIGFFTKSCAICAASTSLMCEAVRGKSLNWAQNLSFEFEDSVLAPVEQDWPSQLTDLKSFEHLKVNHSRRGCALLPWIALRSAMKSKS